MKYLYKKIRSVWLVMLLGLSVLPCLACKDKTASHPTERKNEQANMTEAKRLWDLRHGIVPDVETLLFRRCVQDSDCVYVANGCCDCDPGMNELSVNRTKLSAFQELATSRRPKLCDCPLMGREPDCGTGGNVCKDGICTYILPGWDDRKNMPYWEYPKGERHYRDLP